jgi:hypothetical protein
VNGSTAKGYANNNHNFWATKTKKSSTIFIYFTALLDDYI